MVMRITAGAFLVCKNKVLLMKRGLHKELAPGLWAGIGGHMELSDITNPRKLNLIETCYREVQEEIGISKADISNLRLRYIVIRKAMRKDGEEISMHHHYIGEVETEFTPPECIEGEFHWVDKKDILDLPMTPMVKEALRHWLSNPENNNVYLVAVNKENDSASILEM